MQQGSAFVAMKPSLPQHLRPAMHHRQLLMAASISDAALDIETTPQQDQLSPETAAVDQAAKSGGEVGKILGVSTTTAIVSYLAASHFDTGIAQATVSTLQHLSMNIATQLWGSYESFLQEHPVAGASMTSATVYTIGDAIAQRTERSEQLDTGRLLRSGLAGGIGHGPMSHLWYHMSEAFFNHVIHLTQWWSFIPKIAVDQTIWGTMWNTSYIVLLGLMKRESVEKMVDDVKSTTLPLFLDGLRLWPLVHCVTYGLIPVEHRLLWVDIVEIIWVSILASKASSLGSEHNGIATRQSMDELSNAKI